MYIYTHTHTHIHTHTHTITQIHETYIYMILDLRYIFSRQKLFITAFR